MGPPLFPLPDVALEPLGVERRTRRERGVEPLDEHPPARAVEAAQHAGPLLLGVLVQEAVARPPERDLGAGIPLVERPLVVGRRPAPRVAEPAAQEELASRGQQVVEVVDQVEHPSARRGELLAVLRAIGREDVAVDRPGQAAQGLPRDVDQVELVRVDTLQVIGRIEQRLPRPGHLRLERRASQVQAGALADQGAGRSWRGVDAPRQERPGLVDLRMPPAVPALDVVAQPGVDAGTSVRQVMSARKSWTTGLQPEPLEDVAQAAEPAGLRLRQGLCQVARRSGASLRAGSRCRRTSG